MPTAELNLPPRPIPCPDAPSGVASISLYRVGSTNTASTVYFSTTTSGTAVAGRDYAPITNQLVTFNPELRMWRLTQSSTMVYLEGNLTVGMTLTNTTGSELLYPSNATLTIEDTVDAPGTISFASLSYSANASDGAAQITLSRTGGTSGTISVTCTNIPGTALLGVNYRNNSETTTFNDGVTSVTLPVQLINYPLPEQPVNLSLQLLNPTGGASLGVTNAVLTINNTNAGVAFASATNAFIETAGSASLFVSRFGNINNPLTVNYATTNGTALAGRNFTAVSGHLTFASGQTLAIITVPLIYYPAVTGDLWFSVGLSSPNPAVQVIAPQFTTVIEHDADAGISFTATNTTVAKDGGAALVQVVTSNTNVEPYSVNYSTADGSALANIHYVPASGTLSFSNGVATNYFYVTILNNRSYQHQPVFQCEFVRGSLARAGGFALE